MKYSVFVPAVALLDAFNVNSVSPGGVTGLGENDAVTPEGRLETENVTGFVNPPVVVTDIRKEELSPGIRLIWLGEMVKLKSCAEAAPVMQNTMASMAKSTFIDLVCFISS